MLIKPLNVIAELSARTRVSKIILAEAHVSSFLKKLENHEFHEINCADIYTFVDALPYVRSITKDQAIQKLFDMILNVSIDDSSQLSPAFYLVVAACKGLAKLISKDDERNIGNLVRYLHCPDQPAIKKVPMCILLMSIEDNASAAVLTIQRFIANQPIDPVIELGLTTIGGKSYDLEPSFWFADETEQEPASLAHQG